MNTELVPGTQVVVSRRGYGHDGIYAGRDQYLLGCIGEISLDQFMELRPLHVGVAPDGPFRFEIVRRGRSRLGEWHYDLLSNNSEHFCSWCEFAEPGSPQVEALGKSLRLRLQVAVSTGPHWRRFLRRVAFLESDGRLSASREGHAAQWASRHVNCWVV